MADAVIKLANGDRDTQRIGLFVYMEIPESVRLGVINTHPPAHGYHLPFLPEPLACPGRSWGVCLVGDVLEITIGQYVSSIFFGCLSS
jgi:hypothetical protein